MFISKNQKTIRPPSIRLGDVDGTGEIKSALKYLEVVFDNRLTSAYGRKNNNEEYGHLRECR